MKSKKVAIVHDWLCVNGGAEVVLRYLLEIFPTADVYCMVDTLEDREFLKTHNVYTSVLQKFKFSRKRYKYFMPFMPYLVEQFNLKGYDLVISSSHFVAKGVITHPEQLHIAYIYSPLRYAWDLYFEYLNIGALGSGLNKFFMKLWLHKMRVWDFASAYRADYLISDSDFVKKRIKKYWKREAKTIYPPVDIDASIYEECKDDYYVTLSRLVEYKRIDVIIEAFNEMPDKKLIIIGEGRSRKELEELSSSTNIEFRGFLEKREAMKIVSKAKGFVFMAKEDFGIVPIEAQACGTPVVAFGEGGAKETVLEDETGVFVKEQNSSSLKDAIDRFEKLNFSPKRCREFSEKFSVENFKKSIFEYIKYCEEKI